MKNWIEDLKNSLVIISIKGDIRQLNNYTMGRIPARFLRWHIASQYFYDIERILLEIKSAVSLVSKIPNEEFLSTHSMTPEEYIMYHQGYFLDLVHQLKNKLGQFVIAVMTPNYSEKDEKRAEKISKVIADKKVERVINIVDYLREWNADISNGPIALVLKKRTNYHHFKNPLPNAKGFTEVKAQRFLLSPNFNNYISERGRQIIIEKNNQSFQFWQTETAKKMSDTSLAINENMQNIARTIITYLRMSKNKEDKKRSILLYAKIDDITTVKKSPYTISSIQPEFKNIALALQKKLELLLSNELISFYIIGSIARGDFIFGLSDINLVIIIENDDKKLKEIISNDIGYDPKSFGLPIDIKILSKKEFLGPTQEKIRFICKTDSVILSGTDLLKNEKEDKISFNLAWMLNKDFKEYVESAKAIINTSQDLSDREIELITRDLVKRAYRLIFSQVIGNHTKYTSDIKKMRELNNFYYPNNKMFNEKTYSIITHPLSVDRDGLLGIINAFEEKLYPLYDAIDKAVNKFTIIH